jgi:predicted Zn-dependent protease
VILSSEIFQGNKNLDPDKKSFQACEEPLSWRIGRLDSSFGVTESRLKQIVAEAANLWSRAAGRKLLAYSESGDLAINLIYSEEQQLTEDEQRLSGQIREMRLKYYAYRIEYQKMEHEYAEKISQYNNALTKYEEFVKEYKRKMSRWSSESVLPKEVDDHLKNLRKNIEYWQSQEEVELDTLNTHISEMQELSTELNEYADDVNKLIHVYNKNFTDRKTFHQGVYIQAGDQKKINIYQFEDMDKLRLVLAHEIGHALGLKHVSNPQSVMYFQMGTQNSRNLNLSKEDIQAIRDRCEAATNQ